MKAIRILIFIQIITSLSFTTDITCGATTIPGCLKCDETPAKGCAECEIGADLALKSGVSYCINVPDPLASKECGASIIPGCEVCDEDEKVGCATCQKGAGIEEKDGFRYCIRCPIADCEVCERSFNGRQCQKCFPGFLFNSTSQTCFKAIFGIMSSLLGLALFIRI